MKLLRSGKTVEQIIFKNYLFLLYVHWYSGLHVCLCEAVGFPGTGVADSCELGMESGSSGKAASDINNRAISSAPNRQVQRSSLCYTTKDVS